MGKDFHVPLYFEAFLTSTDLMTNEQVGAHIRILCHQADKGHLPESAIIGRVGQPIWESIRGRYRQDREGLWYHPKMEAVLKERSTYVANRLKNLHKESHMDSHMGAHAKDRDISKDGNMQESNTNISDRDVYQDLIKPELEDEYKTRNG